MSSENTTLGLPLMIVFIIDSSDDYFLQLIDCSINYILALSYLIVGLDIQHKFNVYYSGARRFGTDNPYYISYDHSGQRPQQSTDQAVTQKEDASSATDQGTTLCH